MASPRKDETDCWAWEAFTPQEAGLYPNFRPQYSSALAVRWGNVQACVSDVSLTGFGEEKGDCLVHTAGTSQDVIQFRWRTGMKSRSGSTAHRSGRRRLRDHCAVCFESTSKVGTVLLCNDTMYLPGTVVLVFPRHCPGLSCIPFPVRQSGRYCAGILL